MVRVGCGISRCAGAVFSVLLSAASQPAMFVVALLFMVTAAQALPAPQVSFTHPGRSYYQDQAGQYTSNELSHTGAVVQERGYLKTAIDGTLVLVKDGYFQYTSPEGVPVQIRYTADENGFHPEGNVIPIAPAQLF